MAIRAPAPLADLPSGAKASDPGPFMMRALERHGAGDAAEAARLYADVLQTDPDHALALHNLGVLRAAEGRVEEAMALIGRAAEADPSSVEAHCNLGLLLAGAARVREAAEAFRRALSLQPDAHAAAAGLADLEAAEGRLDAAEALYEQALSKDPNYTAALTGIGVVLMQQGRPREAGERFALALALKPDSAAAHYNVANALKAIGKLEECKVFFRQALELAPDFADAWTNIGNVLRDEGDLDEALACHKWAVALKPTSAAVHLNLGQLLRDRGDAEPAREAFKTALRLDPANPVAELCLCMAELPMCYRDEADVAASRERYAARLDALIAGYTANPRPEAYARAVGSSQPFYLAYQAQDDRALQARYGGFVCQVMRDRYPLAPLAPPPRPGERIRLGVVSGFFREHSNWKVPIRGWIAQLDRSRFEVMGYHTGVRQDACTDEARALCDRFVQGPLSLDAWRTRIAEDAPHVLIYPEVGMDPTSAQLAAQRLAELQCAAWGHPDTSGMPTLDAYLSSEMMEPEDGQDHYTEQLVRLPGLGVRLDPPAEEAETLDRVLLGYRPDATVLWCAQSLPKYLPRFDDIFPRIAKQAGDCQFAFIGLPQRCEAETLFLERLEAAFASHGLNGADHIVMLPRMSKAQFMGALAQADVVLDSLGWSGCNSILETLGADLPVVTHAGELMRGRHAAAILRTMGVEETIAASVDDYVALAVRLAKAPKRRARIAAAMKAGRGRLYGDDRCVRALETFIEQTVRPPDAR